MIRNIHFINNLRIPRKSLAHPLLTELLDSTLRKSQLPLGALADADQSPGRGL
jgi:hypothetical protein